MELLFLRVTPLHINEESPALFSLLVHFQTGLMRKKWVKNGISQEEN